MKPADTKLSPSRRAAIGPSPTETRAAGLTGSGPALIATGTLDQPTDLAGLTYALENGLPQNVLGGIGSGLAWPGGTTFLAVPDRGPNATTFDHGDLDDDTTSFIARSPPPRSPCRTTAEQPQMTNGRICDLAARRAKNA